MASNRKMIARYAEQLDKATKALRLTSPAAERGIDGCTLGDRLKACMKAKSRQLGREYRQKDLLRDANMAAQRGPTDLPVISQQGLSLILKNKRSESAATPAFAAALGVEALWLQYGVGEPSFLTALLSHKPR